MSGLTFSVVSQRRDELELRLKAASAALKAIPGVGQGAMGLTPDSVKQSVRYRVARQEEANAFASLRAVNAFLNKNYAAELREEREQRRAALIAAHG